MKMFVIVNRLSSYTCFMCKQVNKCVKCKSLPHRHKCLIMSSSFFLSFLQSVCLRTNHRSEFAFGMCTGILG